MAGCIVLMGLNIAILWKYLPCASKSGIWVKLAIPVIHFDYEMTNIKCLWFRLLMHVTKEIWGVSSTIVVNQIVERRR
jgi:hypothetical protein